MNERKLKTNLFNSLMKEGYIVEPEYRVDNTSIIDFRVENLEIEFFIECKGRYFSSRNLISQLKKYKNRVDILYLAIPNIKELINRWKSFIIFTEINIGLISVSNIGHEIILECNYEIVPCSFNLYINKVKKRKERKIRKRIIRIDNDTNRSLLILKILKGYNGEHVSLETIIERIDKMNISSENIDVLKHLNWLYCFHDIKRINLRKGLRDINKYLYYI